MRKFTVKKFFALLLIPIVLFLAIYYPAPAVRADSLLDDLVYYGLTVSGYMRMTYTDGGGGGHDFGQGVSKGNYYTKDIFDNLRAAVKYAYDNHHIDVSSGGDISFDQRATNDFYNVIVTSGLGGSDAILLNINQNYRDPQTDSHNDSTSNNYFTAVKNTYTNPLYMSFTGYISSSAGERNDCIVNSLFAFDMSNVAFAVVNGKQIDFYGSDYNPITVDVTYTNYIYNTSEELPRKYKPPTTTTSSSTYVQMEFNTMRGNTTGYLYPTFGTLSLNSIQNVSGLTVYDTYSRRSVTMNYYFSCPGGLVVGSTFNDAMNAYIYTREPAYICPNITNVFPTISADQYNTTNFEDSYNTYVTNVNNNYNNLNNPDFDINDFQQIANDQNQILLNAINTGVENITGVIQNTNQKLDTIIGLLMHIRDMIKDFEPGSGTSGGGSFTAEEIEQLLTDLEYIKNNVLTTSAFDSVMNDVQDTIDDISQTTDDNYDELVSINNKLVDIYNAIIGQGGTTQNNYYYGDNYYINNYHNNSNNMDDFIDDAQDSFDDSVIDAMKGVVPFVFIIMAGSLFEKLAMNPEAPHFDIPFKIDSFGIDESIEIDLANYGAIHDVLDLGWCMLLIAALMVVTFKALYLVASTFF